MKKAKIMQAFSWVAHISFHVKQYAESQQVLNLAVIVHAIGGVDLCRSRSFEYVRILDFALQHFLMVHQS